VEIISTHHAEDKFPAVAAASIIAKTTRDRIVRELHGEFGDFGSGYPSDPKTRAYLREILSSSNLPRIVRRSWKTIHYLEDYKLSTDPRLDGLGATNSNSSD
jgi:ribonuclease HII